MRRRCASLAGLAMLLSLCLGLLAGCGQTAAQAAKVRVLIVPKFEIGEMSGDYPGEAQLFYERYCAGCDELEIPNCPPTTRFYLNGESGVGLLVTGEGKTAAGLSLMSLLSCDAYDFSDTTIVSVGCAGGSTGSYTLGDVVLVTAACDYDLGHGTDSKDLADPEGELTWFPNGDYSEYSSGLYDPSLCEATYELVRDCPLRTTELAKRVLSQNFPGEQWAQKDPSVRKGTTVTGDNYWKGETAHRNACYVANYYGCPDEYAVTEMEEIAIMNAARCFGLEDRIVCLRVVVDMDTFLNGESPETLWLEGSSFDEKVTRENSEMLDVFEPSMQNLFDVGQIVVDAALAGKL